MRDYGFIRPSTSPVGAAFFLLVKRMGACIDYRSLNYITIKNRYPLPLMNSVFERLQGVRFAECLQSYSYL